MSLDRSIGLFGLGNFGLLAAEHLTPHAARVVATDPDPDRPTPAGVTRVEPAEAAAQDVLILAVNAGRLGSLARTLAPRIRGQLVVDVCSVKLRPLATLADALPANARILGTHPLFGPQTVRERGLRGQPIAVCPTPTTEGETAAAAADFLASTLGLRVIEVTPDEHDRQMARVQALTHLVGHAAAELGLADLPLATLAYRRLLQLKHNIGGDSPELFAAIQHENPYAEEARRAFLAAMAGIHARATGDKQPGGGSAGGRPEGTDPGKVGATDAGTADERSSPVASPRCPP